jgi:hypothetical protein
LARYGLATKVTNGLRMDPDIRGILIVSIIVASVFAAGMILHRVQ